MIPAKSDPLDQPDPQAKPVRPETPALRVLRESRDRRAIRDRLETSGPLVVPVQRVQRDRKAR